MKKIILNLSLVILGGLTALMLHSKFGIQTIKSQEKETAKVISTSISESSIIPATNYISAAERTINGVVHVKTEGTRAISKRSFDPLKQFFYGNGNVERQYIQPIKGAGSGVILSEDGYIVTNNHVIEEADKIRVTLNNKMTYDAELIGRDPRTDLAVLKIEESNLPSLNFGNSDEIRVGEWVLAVGNPFNLTSTVTAGIISAKGRDINILENDPYTGMNSIESFIQTDAAVNPGNSGGALVNTNGELIGINAAIKSNTGSFAGYSFAIPANIVKKVMDDLVEYGEVQRAFIGVKIREIDENLADEKGLSNLEGIYVSEISPDGSADKAGIKEGDVIKSVNGLDVNSVTELQAKIGEYRPGNIISIGLMRGNKQVLKKLTLKNLNGDTEILTKENASIFRTLGVKFKSLSPDELERLNLKSGIRVEKLYPGKLMDAGIREGFVLSHVNNLSISRSEDLEKLLSNKTGGILLQGRYSKGEPVFYAIGL